MNGRRGQPMRGKGRLREDTKETEDRKNRPRKIDIIEVGWQETRIPRPIDASLSRTSFLRQKERAEPGLDWMNMRRRFEIWEFITWA